MSEISLGQRDLLLRAQALSGADLERMRDTLQAMLADSRPSDADLLEARDFFSLVGELSLTKANSLMRGEEPWSFPPTAAPPQRPGVKMRLQTRAERGPKPRARPSDLAE